MTTGTIEPHGALHATVSVQVSLNRAAKPGRIAFKRDGSILRTYRLGRWHRAPSWVRDVAALVVAGAS